MKALGILIVKEFLHILRDYRTLLILFGLPIVQILLFGFAINNEIKDARIAIVDPSHDAVSRGIRERLLSSGYFILDGMAADAEAVHQLFQEDRIKLAVVFPADLQQRFYRDEKAQVQLIADASEPNTATTLVNYATAILNDYQQEKLGLASAPLQIRTETAMRYNPEMRSVFLFVPGVMVIILMLISAMMTSVAITREKELGTMEVLLVSPVRPLMVVLGKVVPYFLLGMLIAGIAVCMGNLVFGLPVRGSYGLLLGEMVLFVMTSLALGILISTRTDSQMVAMMLSLMALMMPTILLSGFIFPIESMPRPLQIISHILPGKWFLIILKNVMLKGVGFAYVWKETAILSGMLLLLLAAGIRNFKIRLA